MYGLPEMLTYVHTQRQVSPELPAVEALVVQVLYGVLEVLTWSFLPS